MKSSALLSFVSLLGLVAPVHSAELIRCPDAALLMASAERAVVARTTAPKADFLSVVSAVSTSATLGSEAGANGVRPGSGSGAKPLDPLGLLHGNDGAASGVPAPVPATGPAPGKICRYVLRDGDEGMRIAARFFGTDVTKAAFAEMNPTIDLSSLRAGQSLRVPCPRPAAASAAAAPGAVSEAGASVDGRSVTTPGQAAVASPGVRAATGEVPPAAPPLPTWTAEAGDYFTDVVKRWARKAGYTVVVATSAEWRLAVPVTETASIEDAIDRVAKGLGGNGRAPFVQIFPNKVVKIGGGA